MKKMESSHCRPLQLQYPRSIAAAAGQPMGRLGARGVMPHVHTVPLRAIFEAVPLMYVTGKVFLPRASPGLPQALPLGGEARQSEFAGPGLGET